MYEAFDKELADFTGMREKGELYINHAIHKTYLNVFEGWM